MEMEGLQGVYQETANLEDQDEDEDDEDDDDDDEETDEDLERECSIADAAVNAAQRDRAARLVQIAALRRAALIDRLRVAREELESLGPIREAEWIEWVDDEMRLHSASDASGAAVVGELLERATQQQPVS